VSVVNGYDLGAFESGIRGFIEAAEGQYWGIVEDQLSRTFALGKLIYEALASEEDSDA
jgi:hypothetical protein